MVAAATVVLTTGTLVTGTGPNSGDARADRLSFELEAIARVHGVTVWVLVAVTLALVLRLRSLGDTRWGSWLLAAMVTQGGIGYLQFSLGVPPGLVAVHIVGAMVVWCGTLLFHLGLSSRSPGTDDQLVTAGAAAS